ncbi:MAG: smalltalk protein [Prevotella sp.]|jgi:hypothetical protein|nr:smalltalk protein [Prevotella sp.]
MSKRTKLIIKIIIAILTALLSAFGGAEAMNVMI